MRRFLAVSAFLLASSGLPASAVIAPGDVHWGKNYRFDSAGYLPSIAIVGETDISVHQGQTGAGSLWWDSGSYSSPPMAGQGQVQAGISATAPALAAVANFVFEVDSENGELVYRTPSITSAAAHFPGADIGYNPSVAATIDTQNGFDVWDIVLVYQETRGFGALDYRIGSYCPAYSCGTEIWSWNDPPVRFDDGINPTVGISESYNIVEVHQGQAGAGRMWYHFGCWRYPLGCGFQAGNELTNGDIRGAYPSIVARQNGRVGASDYVVMVLGDTTGVGDLDYVVGNIVGIPPGGGGQLTFDVTPVYYDHGIYPKISINNTGSLLGAIGQEVHGGGTGVSAMWQHSFTVDVH